MSSISVLTTDVRSYKVLVADDNPLNRLLLRRFLLKMNHEADFAENGAIALDLLNASSYDLLILDIQMPVLNGYDTACEIRNNTDDRIKNIPILALTATILQDDLERIAGCGINDTLMQPYNMDQLAEKIDSLMNKKLSH